jgi:hypothetical protein
LSLNEELGDLQDVLAGRKSGVDVLQSERDERELMRRWKGLTW